MKSGPCTTRNSAPLRRYESTCANARGKSRHWLRGTFLTVAVDRLQSRTGTARWWHTNHSCRHPLRHTRHRLQQPHIVRRYTPTPSSTTQTGWCKRLRLMLLASKSRALTGALAGWKSTSHSPRLLRLKCMPRSCHKTSKAHSQVM